MDDGYTPSIGQIFHSTCFNCKTDLIKDSDDPLGLIWKCPNINCDFYNYRVDPIEDIYPDGESEWQE